jgi:uncharacterized protein YegJ (DUF2314 family)
MKIFLTSLVLASLTGMLCAENETTHLAGRENKSPGPPGYTMVPDNDRAVERAVSHARRHLGFFVAVMKAKKPDDSGFEVKKAFVDGNSVEHLWIGDLTWDGKNFHGRVNNKPLDVSNVRLGQKVTVAPREVTDWMFIKSGKMMGGFTTRVLYARLSPKERAEFNKEADFKIE